MKITMKKINLLLISLMLMVGCAKKVTPTPEAVKSQLTTETVVVETMSTVEIISTPEVVIKLSVSSDDAEVAPLIEEVVDTSPMPQKEIKPSFDFDQVFPDSVWTNYMTKRGDYLSLIAYNEYDNANEWRRIYNWNKKHWEERKIGPNKENPNFIYPYKELDLKKPAENAIEWAYEFNIHLVSEGESLWTIAQEIYHDELAWVVLFWDNEDLLNKNHGNLHPGMEIKVRSELWPEFE